MGPGFFIFFRTEEGISTNTWAREHPNYEEEFIMMLIREFLRVHE